MFDICHGCRRCLIRCNAFTALFDLVEKSKTMDVEGLDKVDHYTRDCVMAARHMELVLNDGNRPVPLFGLLRKAYGI